jgi:exodeoxyribonuclease-3
MPVVCRQSTNKIKIFKMESGMVRKRIKLISWNINGLPAVMKKGFLKTIHNLRADIFAIQETKLQEPQLSEEMRNIMGYDSYWSHAAVKKGFSGVGVYTSIKPRDIKTGLGQPVYDNEGRIIELDFGDFIFFNIYFPNGKMSAERLHYKLDFYKAFFKYADFYSAKGRKHCYLRRF